jgi:chitodextrinase
MRASCKTFLPTKTWKMNLLLMLCLAAVASAGILVQEFSSPGVQAASSGLVAAYSFNEGSGTTVNDASGNGNSGTISGATWTTAGKYGSALVFNGRSSRVNINDSASLHLSSGMTLEAWVSASSVPTFWQDVIYKENDIYFLEAGSGVTNHPPAVGALFLTNGDQFLAGTSALKANTWTHLAATYDGTTLRLYVNGVQVASQGIADSLTSSTQPLQIGSDAAFGQYFKGTIDEVRIYNRALATTEIQTDMATQIAQSGDTQAPTAPTNLSATASSTTAINLSWTASTDNVGVTNYFVERCAGTGCTSFAQIATPATTTFSDSGLTPSTSYSYRARATDAAGNLGGYSNVATAATPALPDTTAPSAPSTLAATAVSVSQINLSWTASMDNVGVTNYLVERCAGTGCTSFAQIAMSATNAYNNTGLAASTSYSYRVRATDAAGNLSGYSNVATAATPALPDTTAPSAPSNLAASVITSNQINLSWTASTDNVGVTNYLVERCAGTGCTNFAQIATSTATTYNNTSLAASTPYGYRVRATDAAGNLSAYSNSASGTTQAAPQFKTIAYVQGNFATPQANQTIVSVPYTAAQVAGDLNVAVVGWNDTLATISSVADSQGNAYTLAAGPTQVAGTLEQAIYYAKNITGAAANANIFTVSFNGAATSPDVRILEYSGLDYVGPVDVAASATGNSKTSTSASATTTNSNDLILGANIVVSTTTGAGSGFTNRMITTPDGDIVEDKTVTATGSYSTSAPLGASAPWIMQMVAFKAAAAGALPPPPISVSLAPQTASVQAGLVQSFAAAVQNDSQNAGVNWSLSGAGCAGAACGTLSGVTSTAVVYTAPATVPNPATVVLLGTSASDKTKSAVATIAVTPAPGIILVNIAPRRAAVTLTQPQTFSAVVTGDPQNLGVTWSVDGNIGGNSTTGTITTSGVYTPGTQTGMHAVSAVSVADGSTSASATVAVTDLAGVFTHQNDPQRTGQNLNEYALSPATVSSTTFGNVFSCSVNEGGTVPGFVYAQPLYQANLTMADGTIHNVVFVATESDFVYAFDADASPCQQLWKASMLDSAHGAAAGSTTVPAADTGETGDLVPEIGITSTPVIDPTTNTIYVSSKTKEPGPVYVHRLHALDLTTGAEKLGAPVTISANGFVPLIQLQRPALLLNNGIVYLAFGSHGDQSNYHGWVMGYDKTLLTQIFAWASTDLSSSTMGGIWGGGSGPAADPGGGVWVETGNGNFDGTINYGDSVVRLGAAGTVADFFTPSYQDTLRANDVDLGSGGVTILPDSAGSPAHPHLSIATGKTGVLYLLDQTNLGQFSSSANNDVQEVVIQTLNTTTFGAGVFGKTVYWNGSVYVAMVGDSLRQYAISQGALSGTANAISTHLFAFPGATPSISANATSGGIVWALDIGGYRPAGPAVLYAFDATNVATLLYTSPTSGAGVAGTAVKFSIPTVANGKVYVGGQGQLTAFGLLP